MVQFFYLFVLKLTIILVENAYYLHRLAARAAGEIRKHEAINQAKALSLKSEIVLLLEHSVFLR